jgi:hypothetical protein
MLPIPNVPVPVSVICDKSHWVLTSDASVTTGWALGNPGGWSDSPAGKLALSKAPQGATLIGSSDTPAVLRTVGGYLNMALGMASAMDPQQKQSALQAFNKLGVVAKPGYLFAAPDHGKIVIEDRGLFGFIGIPLSVGVVAGFMAPSAHKSRAQAGEAAAVATLKSGILPAEVQFQAGGYMDQDGNGIGEYGLLTELGGVRPVTGAPALNLVNEEVAKGEANGYHFVVYLPDAAGAALAEPEDQSAARPADAKAATAQERHWVAYAWPEDETGKRMFAMTEDGVVRVAPYLGDAPGWADVFGGDGWEAKPTWEAYHR